MGKTAGSAGIVPMAPVAIGAMFSKGAGAVDDDLAADWPTAGTYSRAECAPGRFRAGNTLP
jgi:hypothetical protein